MHLEFEKTIQFTLYVKAGDRLREFNFRKLKTNKDTLTVNVINEKGDRVFFSMEKKENDWELTPINLPEWIEQNKNKINKAVEEELNKIKNYA